MNTEKVRYTAEDMREASKRAAISSHRHALVKSTALAKRDFEISEMLAQAARTEADVAGLVEVLKVVLDNAHARTTDYGPTGHYDIEVDHLDKAKASLARFQP